MRVTENLNLENQAPTKDFPKLLPKVCRISHKIFFFADLKIV